MAELRDLTLTLPASAVALAADTAVLDALVRIAGWHYQWAAAAGFATGLAIAYLFAITLIFPQRRQAPRDREFAIFALVGVGGLLINAAAMWVAVAVLHQHYLFGKFAAASTSFSFNFFLRRQLLFSADDGGARAVYSHE